MFMTKKQFILNKANKIARFIAMTALCIATVIALSAMLILF